MKKVASYTPRDWQALQRTFKTFSELLKNKPNTEPTFDCVGRCLINYGFTSTSDTLCNLIQSFRNCPFEDSSPIFPLEELRQSGTIAAGFSSLNEHQLSSLPIEPSDFSGSDADAFFKLSEKIAALLKHVTGKSSLVFLFPLRENVGSHVDNVIKLENGNFNIYFSSYQTTRTNLDPEHCFNVLAMYTIHMKNHYKTIPNQLRLVQLSSS